MTADDLPTGFSRMTWKENGQERTAVTSNKIADIYRRADPAANPHITDLVITDAPERTTAVMTTDRPRYRLTPPPNGPKTYGPYLEMYGYVYGDMSDPVKRAEVVTRLRHRDARTLAAARRDLRAQVTDMSTEDIEYRMRVKRYQIDECADLRPWNIRNADIHTYRMLANETDRRARTTPSDTII